MHLPNTVATLLWCILPYGLELLSSFLILPSFPSGANSLFTRQGIRDQEIPKAGDMVLYTLRLVTASSQLSLNSQTLTTIREEWICSEFFQPWRVPEEKHKWLPIWSSSWVAHLHWIRLTYISEIARSRLRTLAVFPLVPSPLFSICGF